MVNLTGPAAAVGRTFGTINGADIREHVDAVLVHWREHGLSCAELAERCGPMERFCERFAPYWLDELAACAEAAGVRDSDYLAFVAGKSRDLFLMDECTSFLAVGAATADGATLFHKNRDNTARNQCAYHKRIEHSSRPAAFSATGDTSDQGVMMMVNEHGLAGSADMGGLPVDRPASRGVMNPQILRVIAERATTCEEALAIIQECLRDGWYAGGAKTGTHWLFADRRGTGLRIAQNSDEEQHWFCRDDIVFLARGDTPGAELARSRRGQVALRDMNAAATHPSICFQSSISAMTARIDPADPTADEVWFALPAWAPYVPLIPPATPAPLLDGGYYRATESLATHRQDGFGAGVQLPPELNARRAEAQERIYALAAERTDDFDRRCCEIGMGLIEDA